MDQNFTIKSNSDSVLTDPQNNTNFLAEANTQYQKIVTSYISGEVQSNIENRGWTNLNLPLLDIPIWQLLGSKEVKHTKGISLTQSPVSNFSWARLEDFTIRFKDINLAIINTDNTQNSATVINDPIIEIRKIGRGVKSLYIPDDWENVLGFYEEDYGDLETIKDGGLSFHFQVGGNIVKLPKRYDICIHNYNYNADFTNIQEVISPMLLGDLVYPKVSRQLQNTLVSATNNSRVLAKGQIYRVPYNMQLDSPYLPNLVKLTAKGADQNADSGRLDLTDLDGWGNQFSKRLGQWSTSDLDYEFELRVRNMPLKSNAFAKINYLLTYAIEIEANWSCKLSERVIYKEPMLLPLQTYSKLGNVNGWVKDVVKIVANAFIDWAIPGSEVNEMTKVKVDDKSQIQIPWKDKI